MALCLAGLALPAGVSATAPPLLSYTVTISSLEKGVSVAPGLRAIQVASPPGVTCAPALLRDVATFQTPVALNALGKVAVSTTLLCKAKNGDGHRCVQTQVDVTAKSSSDGWGYVSGDASCYDDSSDISADCSVNPPPSTEETCTDTAAGDAGMNFECAAGVGAYVDSWKVVCTWWYT